MRRFVQLCFIMYYFSHTNEGGDIGSHTYDASDHISRHHLAMTAFKPGTPGSISSSATSTLHDPVVVVIVDDIPVVPVAGSTRP